MKYVIIVIVVLGILFGLQMYLNSKDIKNNSMDTTKNTIKLGIEDTVVGTGAEAVAGKQITVHYTGRFTDGKVFDSSVTRGQPFEFILGAGQVIKGWDEGFAGMKVGGKRILTVPPEFGYGMNTYGSIPGGSTLIFEVELLKVQ